MKTSSCSPLLLALLMAGCSSIGIDGQFLQPADVTATALAASNVAPTSTSDLSATAAVEQAVRLTLTALAPSPTDTLPPSPTAKPTTASPPTETPLPTATATTTAIATPTVTRPAIVNLALNKSTRASNSFQSASGLAVDGNGATGWGAGDYPPQWIEIDLGAPATITSIRLLVTQNPYGDTLHRVLVRSVESDFSEVVRFGQYTNTGLWLVFTPVAPIPDVQIVRIETLTSPSWVGWLEVQILGES